MSWLRLALRGFPGHPIHPPLTDVTVGALTVGSLATIVGSLGVRVELLAPTAYVALLCGLLAAVPTAVTGLADLLELPAGSPAQTTATIHLVAMTAAVSTLLVAFLLLDPGATDAVPGDAAAASAIGFGLLVVGGWIGGSLVFRHAVRVDGGDDVPTRDALRPRRPS